MVAVILKLAYRIRILQRVDLARWFWNHWCLVPCSFPAILLYVAHFLAVVAFYWLPFCLRRACCAATILASESVHSFIMKAVDGLTIVFSRSLELVHSVTHFPARRKRFVSQEFPRGDAQAVVEKSHGLVSGHCVSPDQRMIREEQRVILGVELGDVRSSQNCCRDDLCHISRDRHLRDRLLPFVGGRHDAVVEYIQRVVASWGRHLRPLREPHVGPIRGSREPQEPRFERGIGHIGLLLDFDGVPLLADLAESVGSITQRGLVSPPVGGLQPVEFGNPAFWGNDILAITVEQGDPVCCEVVTSSGSGGHGL